MARAVKGPGARTAVDVRAGWRELLTTWQAQLTGGPRAEGTFEPAPPSTVAQAQARLGVVLPPSLLDFYAVTDGLADTGGGPPSQVESLRRPGELGWFRDLETEWAEVWTRTSAA